MLGVLSSETLFSGSDYLFFQGTDHHDIGPDAQFLLKRRLASDISLPAGPVTKAR